MLDEKGYLLGSTPICRESLYRDDGTPRWHEHPRHADLCDFVCLPLNNYEGCGICQVYTNPDTTEFTKRNTFTGDGDFITKADDAMALHVSDQVSVIGYPFGAVSGNVYPLWSTGHLSSEPYVFNRLGVKYIDCRARGGQSGSPVYAVRAGSYETIGGDGANYDGYAYMFLGLYSGRLRKDSDIGIMWEASVIHETAMSVASGSTAK